MCAKYLKVVLYTVPKKHGKSCMAKARLRCLWRWYMMFILNCTGEADTYGLPPHSPLTA